MESNGSCRGRISTSPPEVRTSKLAQRPEKIVASGLNMSRANDSDSSVTATGFSFFHGSADRYPFKRSAFSLTSSILPT